MRKHPLVHVAAVRGLAPWLTFDVFTSSQNLFTGTKPVKLNVRRPDVVCFTCFCTSASVSAMISVLKVGFARGSGGDPGSPGAVRWSRGDLVRRRAPRSAASGERRFRSLPSQ